MGLFEVQVKVPMEEDKFKTPLKNPRKLRSLVGVDSPGQKITIPASPLLERLGYGTGVSVYLMTRTPKSGGYRSPWAIKKVAKRFADQDFSRRLLLEAEILRTLSHPNIVGYRALTKAADGTWCLAMEKAETSLMDLIEQRLDQELGPFEPFQVRRVGVAAARALDYLHVEKLLLHGDLKSANVLVFGDFQSVKLCDFGVALPLVAADGAVRPGHHYVGTEAWSAPEVLDDDGPASASASAAVTSRADVFAYGLTVWEMLSLCLPHAEHLDCSDDDDDVVDDEPDSEEEEERQEAYRAALGTRPSLPDLADVDAYADAVAVFVACTEASPSQRPSAAGVVRMWTSVESPVA